MQYVSFASRFALALLGSMGAGLLGPTRAAQAQEDPRLRAQALQVEQRVERMLAPAIAATVLVRAVVPPMGFGSGSGVMVSKEGEVLTCAHVVDMPGAALTVRLSDGRTFAAKLLGQHSQHDYALLKIEDPPADLSVAPLGDSEALATGDWVVALGHPLRPNRDNQPTVSVGVVRALRQQLAAGERRYPDVVMHDAPLFSGNSGGPLFDLRGRVVGLNAAITLINENGFAIPVARVLAQIDALRAGEALGPALAARRPLLDRNERGGALPGLSTKPLPDDVARHFRIEPGQGEWVEQIEPDSFAAATPLRAHDIVLEVDGRPLPSGALADELERRAPGAVVRFGVLRRALDGEGKGGFDRATVEVRLGRVR